MALMRHSFLITGMNGSKREKAVLSKLKVFFQEGLAQNGWISNLRNLFLSTRVFLCHLSHIQTFHPLPGVLERVLRGEVTSASHSLLTPSWAAAQPAATLQCLHQPVKGHGSGHAGEGGRSGKVGLKRPPKPRRAIPSHSPTH